MCKEGWSASKEREDEGEDEEGELQSIAVCRVFDFYALDEFGFGICSEYEGGFVSFWRNETRRALCAFWLSSREGGLLLLFTVKLGRTLNLYYN